MIYLIGLCVGVSAFLESMAYYRQIRKTYTSRRSTDVSSSSYFFKLGKYTFGTIALILSKNWVGLSMEAWAFIMCVITTTMVVKYKPDKWRML